jgi:hypothetical protein
MWTNSFCQLFSVDYMGLTMSINPSAPSSLRLRLLLRNESPGTDHIPAELIRTRGNTESSVIHKLVNSVWNTEELPKQWNKYIIAPIYKI